MTAFGDDTLMAGTVPFNKSAKAIAAPRSDASAEELLAFERMLADLSARFANVPAEQVESEIQIAQMILRQFLGFDRSTFAEFREDGSLVVLSSTAVQGVDPTPLGPVPTQLALFLLNSAPVRSSQYKTQQMIFRRKRSARPNIFSERDCVRI